LKIKSAVFLALSIVGAILTYVAVSSEIVYAEKQSSMSSMAEMCQSMMNSIPKDVIITAKSGQVASVGKESSIILLVKDKKTNKPLDNADVILHIEEGGPMAMMEKGGMMNMMSMMDNMVEAENIGDGKYLVKFTPDKKGYYTMHTHAIPPGKSMMSMMNNHMDIGIIAR
jgi:hypothetical protein